MRDLNEIIKDVERDLVVNLTIAMRHKRITGIEARNIAKEFMADFPYESSMELFKKLNKMSDEFRVVRKVYIKFALDYEREKDEKIIKIMRNYMKINDFENAINTAKGGV